MPAFVIKGDIAFSTAPRHMVCSPDSYLVTENGVVVDVFSQLPEQMTGLPLLDYSGHLVLPGLVDLHVHAPQYAFRGLHMDVPLLEWLEEYAFPEESKYAEIAYAQKAYSVFVRDLLESETTRACIFSTLHRTGTLLLMEKLEQSGLITMVGKVNMDRNSPAYLQENTESSMAETRAWVEESLKRFSATRPILTPRFIPSCSDRLMQALGKLCREYGLPLQSHLSENKGEIAWVRELCPDASSYSEAYALRDTFGAGIPTLMAHCVHVTEEEMELMQSRQVTVVHCPASNTNIGSGAAPVRRFLDRKMRMGLGTDVAGGDSLSMFRTVMEAVKVSKLRQCLFEDTLAPLTMEEAFYLGTMGGGTFFGQVGSFLPGYEMDAIILEDGLEGNPFGYTLRERVERTIYSYEKSWLKAKFCRGLQVLPDL